MPAYKDTKTGKWFAKFYYTDWQGNNKQKWKRDFATKKEALEYEREFLEKQSGNPYMTMQSLYEIYMEDIAGRVKESTYQHKKNIYETKILPFFGNMPINEIKATDIRKWQSKLMKDDRNFKPTYLKSINNQMSCIMNFAKRFYDLNTDPCGKAGSMGKVMLKKWISGLWMNTSHLEKGLRTKQLPICALRFSTGQAFEKVNFSL